MSTTLLDRIQTTNGNGTENGKTDSRRRRNGYIEELTFEPPVRPRKRTRPPRPKIIKWMAHISDEQRDQVEGRLQDLEQLGGDYSKAELQRLAVCLLLSLSENELIRKLEAQRDLEEQEGYGFGARL